MTVRGINPKSVGLLNDADYGFAPAVGPQVATDLVQKALARGAGPVQAVVEVTAEAAVQGLQQGVSRPGDLRAKLLRTAAWVGGTAAVATWAAWKLRPVDAPPPGKEVEAWHEDLADNDRLMQEAAAKIIELFLAEAMGFWSKALALRDDLQAQFASLSTRTYVAPLFKRPVQAQASADSGGARPAGWRPLSLDEQEREAMLQEMERAGWRRSDAATILEAFLRQDGDEDDYHGDHMMLEFFRQLEGAGFSAPDQERLLKVVAIHYDNRDDTAQLLKNIHNLRGVLSRFSAWTPEWQTAFLWTIITGSSWRANAALEAVYLAMTRASPREEERLYRELKSFGYTGPGIHEIHQMRLIERGPASWPPLDLVATVDAVYREHGAINLILTPSLIRTHRVTIH